MTQWFAITYPGTTADFPTDEQATDDRSDIVGDPNNPALYKAFYDGGTDSAINATDGEMAFRIRMGGTKGNDDIFGALMFIGLDAGEDSSGDIDLFIGLNDKTG